MSSLQLKIRQNVSKSIAFLRGRWYNIYLPAMVLNVWFLLIPDRGKTQLVQVSVTLRRSRITLIEPAKISGVSWKKVDRKCL